MGFVRDLSLGGMSVVSVVVYELRFVGVSGGMS